MIISDSNPLDHTEEPQMEESLIEETQILWKDKAVDESEEQEDENKTIILAELNQQEKYYLISCNHVAKNIVSSKHAKNITLANNSVLDNAEDTEIPIDKFPFIIGKSTQGVNLMIEEPSVSRFHAKFNKEGDDIYLIDLNSTNGTYVNGIKIKEHKFHLVKENDEIAFAQIKYYWRKHK